MLLYFSETEYICVCVCVNLEVIYIYIYMFYIYMKASYIYICDFQVDLEATYNDFQVDLGGLRVRETWI